MVCTKGGNLDGGTGLQCSMLISRKAPLAVLNFKKGSVVLSTLGVHSHTNRRWCVQVVGSVWES